MDTGMQQSTDANSSILVAQGERQAVLQKL